MDLDDDDDEPPAQVIGGGAAGTGGEDEEIPDLDDMDDDDNMFSQPVAQPEEAKGGESNVQIIKARKYDLSITYD